MEDTAVINFLSNLTQLAISGHRVIAKEKDELLCLHNKIEYMNKFLKMTEEKRSRDQQVRRLVMQMRDTMFEAENIIDLFVIDAITVGDGAETDLSVKLEGIKKDIEAIEDRVKTMTNSNAEITLVGFEQDVDSIIGKIEDGKHLQIISIVGRGGTGKTTLAEKLYQDIRTQGAFEIQAWVTVSKRHQAKELLMDILESSSLLSYTDSSDRQSLGQQLYTKLKDKKFLIVIDNIWEVKPWKDIREYLPDQCNGSTVICTSRSDLFHEDTEMHQHQMISEYFLKPLPPEECWELLQIKVFGNQNSCPEQLQTPGKIIAKQCDGLVLAVVVIGGLLAKKEKTSKWWNHVSKSMLERYDSEERLYYVLELAYNCLPLHLKACFLYLSIFPEGEEISVTILTWMIVAEGYIIHDQIVEGKTVEDIAEGYINELVDRSLLTVSKKRSDGSTKACRINVILRNFAIKKGGDESFLLDQQGIHRLSLADKNRHRRLSLFDKRYLLKLPIGKCRSLVLFGLKKDPETVFADPTIAEEDAFRLLKVLDLLSIRIMFPSNIGNWFHAKYLALRSEVTHLPQSFTNLSNLETLVLYSRNIVILPHDIWKMVKLRHIYNKIGIFHFGTTAAGQTAGQNISLENLQTLSPLCGCKTCVDMLVRAPNIRKLQLHGNFISMSGHLVFPDLNFLMQLKSLKLTNAMGHLGRLGRSQYTGEVITPKFPPSVRRLTLCNTLLKWEEISVLGSLENLEALKLLDNACVGLDWETSELEFPNLKYLKLKSVDLVKWVDHDMQFQNMQWLILEDCSNLEMLPTGLAQLSQLSLIEVKHCNKHVERLARKIVQQHNKLFGEDKLKTVIISKHPCASVQSKNSHREFLLSRALSSPKLSACLIASPRRLSLPRIPLAIITTAALFRLLVVSLFRKSEMEDTAVINFLSNLTQLAISGHQVIAKEKDELLCLHNKIEYMIKFLKMTEEKRSQDQQVRRLVMQMRDIVFEAENIIDLFVIDAITVGDGTETDLSVKLEGIKKDREAIEDRVKTSNAEMTLVGFEAEVDSIIGKIEDDKHLKIISIVGMSGTGKTTLAENLYQDFRTKGAFEIQAWVTVSQRHQAKDLLRDILESSSLLSYTGSRNRQSLGQQLYTKLKDKKFLIVIDNISKVETWEDIVEYVPGNIGSTIICTSRRGDLFQEDAEMHKHQMFSQYFLKPLPPEECWELLQIKVFGNQNSCPEELEMPGKIIAQQCHGLVLAIVVIGGLLAKKEKTSKWWNYVSERIRRHGNDESPCTDVLELAYNCLPLHLKACFLYLPFFPEDEEISVTKLSWMLVAEGFIIQDQIVEGKTVEDIAEGYINELVDRSLLTVTRKRSDGSTKACHINVILRDFAIKKGGDESFLLHQQRIHHRPFPANQNRHRRLSLLVDKGYLRMLPIGNCRSLVLFGVEKDPDTVLANPPAVEEDAFRLLKVLELLSISIDFPSNIGNWFHAKYLALRSEVKHLPQSFTNLSNLETLVLYSRNTVVLPHDIWKMVKLRHIYNKIGIFHFGTTSAGQTAGQNISLENLQTLSPLCGCKTCVEMLVRAPIISKLQLHGKFISKSGHLVLPDLNFMMQLKSLKLTNATGRLGRLGRLGRSRYIGEVITPKFPPSVRRLTLCNTLLKWEEISVLGSLENLEALKLLDNACVGSDWETSELEFPNLKYLKLKRINLVKWVDHDMQFQNMQSLILEDCPNLKMLPTGLAQLSQLSLIEVKHCNKHAERLARKIVQQHNKLFGEDKLKTVIIPKN